MKYNLAFKHAEKIAKKVVDSRPTLTGIHHKENKVIATDSHRLLHAKIDKMTFEDHVLPTKPGVEINGEYPKTDKLISDPGDMLLNVKINHEKIGIIRQLLKTAKTLKFDHGVFKVLNDTIHFETVASGSKSLYDSLKDTHLSIKLGTIEPQEDAKEYTLNINYLIDLFDFLHDTKKETTLCLSSNILRPIQLTTDDYDYIVMPIRKH